MNLDAKYLVFPIYFIILMSLQMMNIQEFGADSLAGMALVYLTFRFYDYKKDEKGGK